MHKTHHKIILGIAALAVIAGIVYVANLQGKAATCPPTTVALSKATTLDYKSTTGDIISFDGSMKLSSSNTTMGVFSIDQSSWSPVLDLNLLQKSSTFYYSIDPKNGIIAETFTNAKLDLTTGNLSFDVAAPAVRDVVLDPATPYIMASGADLNFDGTQLYSKMSELSIDGGVTYLKLGEPVNADMLQKMSTSGIDLYVQTMVAGRPQQDRVIVRRVDMSAKSLTLGIAIDCSAPPVDPCANTTVTLNKANQNYLTPLGVISFGGSVLTTDNLNVEFSPNNIDWFTSPYDLNQVAKTGIVYMRDLKTGATFTLTNAKYDALTPSLTFDGNAPATTTKVVLSKLSPTYIAKDGTDFNFDGTQLSSKVSVFSIDGVNYFPALPAEQLLKMTEAGLPLYVMNSTTKEITQIDARISITVQGMELTLALKEAPICGPKDTDNDGVADDADKCPDTKADTVTTLKPRNLAVFDVAGVLTWMTNSGTAKKPIIEPAKALDLAKSKGCSCGQILALKETKEKIDDDKNEREGNYGDEDRDQNRKRDEDNNNSRLKYGCTALGGKDNTLTTKVTGIVGDFIKKAAKWSDDRSQEERDHDEERDREDDDRRD